MKLLGTRNVGETTCVVDNQDLKLLPNINVGVTIVTAEHHECADRAARSGPPG